MGSERSDLGGVVHLTRRLLWSLRAQSVSAGDEAWLLSRLTRAQVDLYRAQAVADRAHAVQCALRAAHLFAGESADDAIVASALHDVGKSEAALSTSGRVLASVVGMVVPASSLESWRETSGFRERVVTYLRHPEIGAELLRDAGSSQLVVGWAREHHWPVEDCTLDPRLAAVLRQADS